MVPQLAVAVVHLEVAAELEQALQVMVLAAARVIFSVEVAEAQGRAVVVRAARRVPAQEHILVTVRRVVLVISAALEIIIVVSEMPMVVPEN